MTSCPHGIMFHHLHDGGAYRSGEGSLSADDFRTILDHYGPRVISAQEWLKRTRNNTLHPEHVCLTFDDALRCQLDIAGPVLEERNLTALWFVYSTALRRTAEDFEIHRNFRINAFDSFDEFFASFLANAQDEYEVIVGDALRNFDPAQYLAQWSFYSKNERTYRYLRDQVLGADRVRRLYATSIARSGYETDREALWLTENDVKSLSENGHGIGLHSYSHPMKLADLSVADQANEYESNFNHLSDLLGDRPDTMAHPVNSYNADTLEILANLGIRQGFTTLMHPISNPLEWPRIDAAIVARNKHNPANKP